ncbi:MAG: carboxymuconolactone decarboxylase family protein [Hyphomonadaceae bacterium]|nr:carboxymuconolactone decarboxylase family protein [Hyphomonadaceae bacterium]
MRRRIAAPVAAILTALVLIGGCMSLSPSGGFSPRLAVPRLDVVDETNLTEAQRDMLGSRANLNIYRTLAHHTDLYNRWSPLGQFLLNGSSISPRHREIAMLRLGWLCQSPYEWAQHARIAKASAGMTDAEVHRIAEGADATGWSDMDRAVIRMADDLRYDTMISDATWAELRKGYSDTQVMELLFTSAQYQLVSMALNTLGVQVEPTAVDFMPFDLPLPRAASRPTTPRLTSSRIAPVAVTALTPQQRFIVAAQIQPDGSLLNLYGTMINHPTLYAPRVRFGSYLQRDSMLDPETRELLIMRTAWNIRAEYEWAHHVEAAKTAGLSDAQIARIAQGPGASGWTEKQRAVLTAADELRREAFVSDATWNTLAKYYPIKERIEIVYTVGGYSMTGLAINSFGIQVEPGYPAMPR